MKFDRRVATDRRTAVLMSVVLTASVLGSTTLRAQDAPAAAAEQPAEQPAAQPAAPPAETPAPQKTAPKPDYARLAEPEIQSQLKLTAEQQTQIDELLKQRSAAIAQAAPADKAQVTAEQDAKLAAVLNEEQRAVLAAVKPVPKLQFNFRFQRWAEVLQWFAEEAGLSLVMDAPPPATFNYTDNKKYTPTEAIDLLNGVLLTKDFTLIRRGRMLIVIDMKQGIPQDLIPRVELKDLDDRGKHEFVSVMFPLGRRSAEEVDQEIKPLLGNQGKSVPLPKTQQILVTATAGNMRSIGAVIESIPEPPPPKEPPKPPQPKEPEKPELRNYPTKTVDAGAAVELINQLIPGIKVVADAKAEQLSVYATPSQHNAVQGVLDKMQTDNPPDKQPSLELYALGRQDGTQLLETLKLIVPGATVRLDPANNNLLAWASPDDQATIKSTLAKMGGGPDRSTAQVEIYSLTKADPTAAQQLLKEVVPNARVSFDAENRNLIVVAAPDDQRIVKATLEQLQPAEPGPNTPVLQFYPFEEAIPAGLVEVLQALTPRAQIRPTSDGKKLIVTATDADQKKIAETIPKFPRPAKTEKPHLEIYPVTAAQRKRLDAVMGSITSDLPGIKIITDAEPGELAVWAKNKEHDLFKDLLDKLQRDVPEDQQFTLATYAVAAPRQSQTTTLLQTMYPELRIVPDAEGERLLIWAPAEQHEKLKATLEKILAEAPAGDRPRFEAYPIQGADAASLLPTLQTLLPSMRLSVDPKSTKLIAWGSPADHNKLLSALEKVGGGTPQTTPQVEVYQLTKADPSATQALLQGLFPAAKLTIDPQTRSLIAVAIPADQQGIRATLEQLQPEAPGPNERKLQFIPLDEAPPPSLISVLQQLAPQAQVTYEPDDKRLMVVATPADHEVIAETVKRVIASALPAEKNQLEIYAVTPAQRTRFQSILDTVQAELPGIRIITDAEPGELAVWAKPSQHKVLADIIEKLTRELPEADQFVLVTYPLKVADPQNTLTVMQTLFPNIKIVLDAKTRKLLVWAPPAEHAKIKDAIDKIDTGAAAELQESYKVYPVRNSDPNAIIALLQQRVPDVQFTNDTAGKAIIAWARQADHDVIAKTLKDVLVGMDPNRRPKLVVYPAGQSDSATVMRGLRQLFPDARIDDDSTSNTVLVWATPDQHEEIKAAMDEISASAKLRNGGEMVIYSVSSQVAPTAQQVVQSAVPRARVMLAGSPPRLVVWAQPAEHEKIAGMVEQIEKEASENDERELAVYDLEGVDANAVMQLINPVLRSETQFVVSTDGKQLIVRAHPKYHAELKTSIESAKEKLPQVGKPTAHVYRLKHVDPNTLMSIVRPIAPAAPMVPDYTQRTLTITATPEQHKEFAEEIAKIDVERTDDASAYLQSYQVKKADPGATYGIVTQMLAGHPEVRLSFDSRNGAIMAFAAPEQHEKIAAVIADVEKDIEGATSEVYRFRNADPNAAISVLRTVAPRAQMTVDNRNRSIVVNAIEADHKTIRETIAKMDADTVDDNGTVLKAYPIKTAEPGNLLSMLQTNFALQPDIRLSADYKNSTIVALATPAQHEKITEFIAAVDKQGKVRTAEVYQFRSADPTAASGILRTLVPQVSMAVDNRNRTLVVTATPEEHALIKATIEKMDSEENADSGAELRSYPIKIAEPNNLLGMLQTNFALQPDIRMSLDSRNDTIVVLARPEQHEKIAAFIEQVEQGAQPLKPQVYRFKVADPNAALAVLRTLTPKAQMAVDQGSRTLVVTATAGDHEKIAATIEEMDREDAEGTGPQLRSYPVQNAQVNTMAQAIQSAFRNRPDVQVTYDSRNNTVAVVAPAGMQEKIKEFIETADQQGDVTTAKVYRFEIADPQAVFRVLRSLTPRADAAVDPDSRSLVVSATDADHAKIKATIEAMEGTGAQSSAPELKVYPLKAAEGRSLQSTLRSLFRRHSEVEINFDENNDSIMALAPPATQTRIAEMIEEVERAAGVDPRARLQVYRVKNIDSRTALEILENALSEQTPKIKLSLNRRGGQIAAVARPEQHLLISETLEQLDADERELEVYQLDVLDPFSAELSIDRLFGSNTFDDPDAPIVDSDSDTQQLFVRANQEQQKQIRELLVKMGETQLAIKDEADQNRRMRIIPFRGDADAAVREIERVWPQLRRNRIRVVTPSAVMPSLRELKPEQPAPPEKKSNKKPSAQFAVPAEEVPGEQLQGTAKPRAAAPESVPQPAADKSVEPPAEQPPQKADDKTDAEESTSAPIIVAPGDGRITIASDDPEALDQFEALLRSMSAQTGGGGRGNDFVVFSLRYTSAVQAATTLQQFFEPQRGRRNPFGSRSFGTVTIVPDGRLNAVIVHANRNDRETIEQLLEVLDTPEVPESLAANRPRLIQVKNTDASRIEDVIRAIYKSALATGGGAPPIPVPIGVSQDVAAAIQRANVANNAPLLTVEVDERTNTLVVMAPTSLFEEIEELVQEMDHAAADNSMRRLKVIQLKKLNTRSLERSLDMLIDNDGRSRRRRRNR